MQRKIQTFRAATMEDALDLVRQELGQDAVVVNSKEVATRRLLPWPSTRQEIEISAEPKPRPSLQHHQSNLSDSKSPRATRTIRTLAESLAEPVSVKKLLSPIADLNLGQIDDPQIGFGLEPAPPSWLPSVQTLPAIEPDRPNRVRLETTGNRSTVETLQLILERLERQSGLKNWDIPGDLIPHYRNLVKQDVDEEIACDLMTKLRQHANSETFNLPESAVAILTALIEREMRCAPPIQPKSGRREIVTLVGPTGVGKTTTIAKLAGHFHLREGLRVGLITIDTYRVGAIEQLRTYAEILQIPLLTASTPGELRVAIDEMDNVDLILIDTAGRSPLDNAKMNELRELIRVSDSDHVMLVLSMAAGGKTLSRIADQFSSISPTSLIVTKLDECPGSGGMLSVAREIPFPIRYLTTGQDVPDQIEPAHPTRLARLILGCDSIHSERTC